MCLSLTSFKIKMYCLFLTRSNIFCFISFNSSIFKLCKFFVSIILNFDILMSSSQYDSFKSSSDLYSQNKVDTSIVIDDSFIFIILSSSAQVLVSSIPSLVIDMIPLFLLIHDLKSSLKPLSLLFLII